MIILISSLMLIILVALAFYAGALICKLQIQKNKKSARSKDRIDSIVESITTIAMAMEHGQCNLSEGCIRIYHLLEALPLVNKPDYSDLYTGIYALNSHVKDLASHQARSQLSAAERKSQDSFREMKEAMLKPRILQDVVKLKTFSL
jgi:hypothetical protein